MSAYFDEITDEEPQPEPNIFRWPNGRVLKTYRLDSGVSFQLTEAPQGKSLIFSAEDRDIETVAVPLYKFRPASIQYLSRQESDLSGSSETDFCEHSTTEWSDGTVTSAYTIGEHFRGYSPMDYEFILPNDNLYGCVRVDGGSRVTIPHQLTP